MTRFFRWPPPRTVRRARGFRPSQVAGALLASWSSVLVGPGPVQAQMAPQCADILQVTRIGGRPGVAVVGGAHGRTGIRSAVFDFACTGRDSTRSFDVAIAPLTLGVVGLSDYPSDRDNGAIWTGRGVSAYARGGGRISVGAVRFDLLPTVAYQQNHPFASADTVRHRMNPFSHPWHSLDWPRRFGAESFWTVHPGMEASLDLAPFEASASTLNLMGGPALRYPLILGTSAAGFPHIRLSLHDLVLGPVTVSTTGVVGRLVESDYFDQDGSNDHRQLFLASLSVRTGDQLELGLLLAHHLQLAPGERFRNPLTVFSAPFSASGGDGSPRSGNTEGNALASFSARWTPTPSVELYGEFGREDYAWDLWDFLGEPDHSRGLTLGMVYRAFRPAGAWVVTAEATALRTTVLNQHRSRPVWYTHSTVRQGHTHDGQLLGSSLGPGSDGQYLAVEHVRDGTSWGGFLERVRWDDDAYLRFRADAYGFRGHDVEATGGARHTRVLGNGIVLDAELALSLRRNRDFINLDGVRWHFPVEKNLKLDVAVGWIP